MTLSSPENIAFSKARGHASAAVLTKAIVITGHRGFLGTAVTEHFAVKPYATVGVGIADSARASASACAIEYEIELPDTRFDKVIQEVQPAALIHCAGTADVAASFRDPPTDYRRNVEATAFVLESLRRYAPRCHFVLLSSAAVYGNPRHLPVSETARCIPISPYGCHKLIGEQIVDEYVSEHGLKAAVLRIFSAYGNGLRRQIVYDLCRKLYDDSQHVVQLFGSGEESRDFIHANDIAAAVEHVVSEQLAGVYNLACGIETTIAELAGRLRELSGRKAEIEFTGKSRAGDPHRWQADIGKLTATGFKPMVTLDDGLNSYLNWYQKLN
ncbi:NAD-dependent epimerase/dehydratase family protein [bacterium]|nr:NAD-dependent epimerase/dehydratase family protein [bacterium]MBU1919460.1 NAD-dependent epimerase/dehydratase family protein [bacterium]